ncbi:MAG TPA: hypothetical protein VH253_08905 [Phycisphaerae bacterium]|nr:hypothetical protein [Phycisphaerae bacterium]
MNYSPIAAGRTPLSGRGVRALLALAVGSGCLVLGACGDTSMSAKTASKDATDGVRLARSAGEMRPTAGFMESVQKDPNAAENAKAAVAADNLNARGAWKQYFEQNSRADDLKAAVDQLNKAAAADVPPVLHSLIQSELGTVSRQYGEELLSQEQDKVLELSRKWTALEDQASYVMALGGEAGVQDARAKVTAADTGAAQSALSSAKDNTGKAQSAVDDLKKQIADKQSRASEIYSQTEAAFQASEKLQGNAAIDAARKAADARKEADQLTADVVNLQLQLDEAQSALNVAQIKQKEAEAKLEVLQGGQTAEQAQAEKSSKLAADLRGQAQKLIDAQEGLKQQYKDFTDLAGQVEKEVKNILAQSTAADKAYGAAVSALGDAQSKLPETADADDPLAKVARDNEAKSILMLQQAAAKTQSGQANLMAAAVASMRAAGESAMNQANSVISGNGGAPAPASSPETAEATYRAAAQKQFKDAESLITSAKGLAGGAIPVQWLAPSLMAAVKYGEYDASHDEKDLQAGQDAARLAMQQNPYLRLNALAGAEPASSESAPSTPNKAGNSTAPAPAMPGPNTPAPPM